MKNKKNLLAFLSAFFLLAGCGESEHTHTFSKAWEKDENQHWHAATCEHKDQKSDVGEHTFGEAKEDGDYMVSTCTVCGKIKRTEIEDTTGGIVLPAAEQLTVDSGLTITSTFANSVEIHTSQQKEYLSYQGDYATIDENKYPAGNQTISDPVKTKLEWNYAGSDVTKYSVTISQNADFSGGFEIMGTSAKSLDIYNLFLGKNYVRVNAYKNDNSKVCSATTEINVDETAPRNLYVGPKMTNCRDMGGRKTTAGGTIRQGVLIRTCGSNYGMNGQYIDDEGKRILKDELGMKTELNLNDSGSYNVKLDGVNIVETFMDYGGSARHHFSRNAENVKNVFNLLAKPESYPIFFHCRIGTDRTGLIANLISGLLGVPLNEIYQDYLFSNFGKIGEKRYIGEKAGQDNIQNYMNEVNSMPGETFQEKTYNALLTIGVSRKTLNKVISLLTIGAKPDNAKDQIVVAAKDMELEGTTLGTEDKTSGVARNHPASYATMKNEATASFDVDVATAGEKTIYAYLGHNENSASKKINESLKVEIDGSEVTLANTTFQEAGMGNVNNRMNYYFVKLGTANFSSGIQSIVVTGLSNSMNLGNIAIF